MDALLAAGQFHLVLGWLHGLHIYGGFAEVAQLLQPLDTHEVVVDDLLEVEQWSFT